MDELKQASDPVQAPPTAFWTQTVTSKRSVCIGFVRRQLKTFNPVMVELHTKHV
jgi:hypothetical protein